MIPETHGAVLHGSINGSVIRIRTSVGTELRPCHDLLAHESTEPHMMHNPPPGPLPLPLFGVQKPAPLPDADCFGDTFDGI